MTPDSFTINEQLLEVGGGHTLYVHEWGNKAGAQTFLFLHGGPGSGCNDRNKAFFDGSRDHVIFFDQRGAGKSTPAGSLESNTTQDLINDINLILDTLGLNQVIIVGGSWGSCLALAYALQRPDRVSAMVLRGIFTGSQSEIDHIDKGHFRTFFPDVWDGFVARAPGKYEANPASYHAPRAVGDHETAIKESAYAYSELEGSLVTLDDRHQPDDFAKFDPSGTRIEVHYMVNRCFMNDNYLLDNAHKLAMPICLIQGRYDMVCPPITAYMLHKRLPNSQLFFTLSGHSGSDRGNFDLMHSNIASLASANQS